MARVNTVSCHGNLDITREGANPTCFGSQQLSTRAVDGLSSEMAVLGEELALLTTMSLRTLTLSMNQLELLTVTLQGQRTI